jgi:hypothetical protein
MKNRIISTVLSALMLSSLLASSFAATSTTVDGSSDVPVTLQTEAPTFSVTVPTSLPLSMKADGSVVTATDCKITNSSSGPVKVTNVDISGTNGWSKLEYNTEFKNIQVDSTSFAMTMNEVESDIADTFSTINTNSDEVFTYAAKVAPQSTAISTDTTIATVVFTIGWDTVSMVEVGDIVSLEYDGAPTNFIVIQIGNPDDTIYDESCDGVWLLSEDVLEDEVIWNKKDDNTYSTSDINTYLNTKVISKFSEDIQSSIQEVRIPYTDGTGRDGNVKTGSDGLTTKLFLLSATEVGFKPSTNNLFNIEGAILEYFIRATDDDIIAMTSDGSRATNWWLRSPYSHEPSGWDADLTKSWFMNTDGSLEYDDVFIDDYGLRVALILPSTYLISK